MAIYEYHCERDGEFEEIRPLGTAPASIACPVCGNDARRVFSTAMLITRSRGGMTAALDRAEKSRYEPEVVTSLPPTRSRRSTPITPALMRLPRP